jgi:16S rRNA (uracil1498-N3)-methyltransferase
MTRRRWIADTWDDATAALTGEQATHLIRVLRAQQGMEFDVVAGTRVYRAVISGIGANGVHLNLLSEIDASSALPLTLLLAVIKFDRFEWALEKVTELGVAQIIPVIARRTEKHLAQAAENRVERWRRIAREAAQQSRRSDVPTIQPPQSLKAALAQTAPADALHILLSETEHQHSMRAALEANPDASEVRVAIGPEGGWTAEEFAAFQQAQWTAVTLGPRILRAETAAMTAAAVCGAWIEVAN